MIYNPRWAANLFLAILLAGSVSAAARLGSHFWPTPNRAFIEGRPLGLFLQPTESGKLSSALWGCVRNRGARFHEGIDLKATRTDERGEPIDAVYAFDDGVVRYVNRDASKSSYGRYVVIEHPQWMPGLVTVYAHLRVVPEKTSPGATVKGGHAIATMGRSANHAIPKSRAHLHFEVGLWLGTEFQNWYDRQRFKTPNDHQAYNGMNIIGLDVWSMLQSLRSGEAANVMEYIAAEPTAVTVTIRDSEIPDILQVNPNLMTNQFIPLKHAGWRIDFASSGIPLRFEALVTKDMSNAKPVLIEFADEKLARSQSCMSLLLPGNRREISPRLNGILQRLFVD